MKCTYECVHLFIATEDHSKEDVYQIPAQRSLYSPHAVRVRLGKWTVHKI